MYNPHITNVPHVHLCSFCIIVILSKQISCIHVSSMLLFIYIYIYVCINKCELLRKYMLL